MAKNQLLNVNAVECWCYTLIMIVCWNQYFEVNRMVEVGAGHHG